MFLDRAVKVKRPICSFINTINVQQDQSQTTGNSQEAEKQTALKEQQPEKKTDGAAPQLVPQQGEIKNNDHDPESGNTSLGHR
jgi:vesicle coat complex subunit